MLPKMLKLGQITVLAILFVGVCYGETIFNPNILCKPECPQGFVNFGTKCYVVPDITCTWGDALEFCHTFDSDLMRINSAEEQTFLENYLHHHNGSHFWVAATDLAAEGDWRWSNTMGPLVHDWWARNQPDNNMNRFGIFQHCVTLNDRSQYKWSDDDCSQEWNFVCERRIY